MGAFIRKFNNVNQLSQERLFKEHLECDIEKGDVFPAIRNKYICFYSGGSRPFVYKKEFATHREYISLLVSDKNYLTKDDLQNPKINNDFCSCYEKILENCKRYSGKEAIGVSSLYSTYSFARNFKDNDLDIVVLDIEVAFENINIESDKKVDKVDLLLYSKSKQELLFVEAKHFSNSEIWSKEGTKPRVVSQIKRYNEQIENNYNDILDQYRNYIDSMKKLFAIDIPYPEKISPQCGLYIFGYDGDQQSGRFKRLIKDDGSFEGINYYSIGNYKNLKIENLWNKLTI